MGLLAKESSGKTYPPAPAGSHYARCIQVIDLGTQPPNQFGKATHKVRIVWELPNEKYEFDPNKGPESYVLGRDFTISLRENSALRPFLERWRGRAFTKDELQGFQLENLVNAPCILSVSHAESERDGKVYANVTGASPLMKGTDCPPATQPKLFYMVEQGKDAVFQALPEWLQKKIGDCLEWKPGSAPVSKIEDADDPGVPEQAAAL